MTADLIAFLKARYDAEEQLAKEASRDDRYGTGGRTETGEHWRWYDTDTDAEIVINPVTDEYVNGGSRAALRSAEKYPTNMAYTLPHFVISNAEEVPAVCGLHIAYWDPGRVLADVDANRRILDWCQTMDPFPGMGGILAGEARKILKWLGSPYAGHPDFREEWGPNP